MSKYGPLREHMERLDGATWSTTFAEIERVLANRLPASATDHRAWWANERSGTHVWAHAWLDAGWRVAEVDLTAKTVIFRRDGGAAPTRTRPTAQPKERHVGRSGRTQQRTQDRLNELRSGFSEFLAVFQERMRFTGPSVYFHVKSLTTLAKFPTPGAAVQDDEFLDLVYATLTAWGMHRMGPGGAKLAEIERIRSSLRRHVSEIDALASLRLGSLDEDQAHRVASRLWRIIGDLDVSASATKLVAGTKALHHILPELVPPMDREYTLRFFFNNKTLSMGDERAFMEIFPDLCAIARERTKEIEAARGKGALGTSASKIVDNAIVGYVLARLGETEVASGEA